MKFTIERFGVTQKFESLEDYAEFRLDGSDYDRGIVEAAAATAQNNSKAIGRILDLLSSKQLVTAEEVATIIEGYRVGPSFFRK